MYLFLAALVFLAALGLFSLVEESWGYSLIAVHGLIFAAASRCMALGQEGLSSCGTWAYVPHGMWNLPRPEIVPCVGGQILTQ